MKNMKFPFFQVEGDAYETGFQYGQLVKEQVHKSIDVYRTIFLERSDIQWNKALEVAETYVPVIQEYDAGAIDEMRGIAEGAETRFLDIVAINCNSEILHPDQFLSGCTAIAVLPDVSLSGHTLLGQNYDWNAALIDSIILLEVKRKGGIRSFNFIEAGMVPTNGMNSAGIGIVGNCLGTDELPKVGIPFAFYRRKILSSKNIYSAIEAIAMAKRSRSSHTMIGSRQGFVIGIEANPEEFYTLYPDRGLLAHANHFISPDFREKDTMKARLVDSLYRDWRMKQILEPKRGKIEVSDLKEALRDHFGYPRSICRHSEGFKHKSQNAMTVGSYIMDLDTGEIQIAAGNPCEVKYEKYRLPLDNIIAYPPVTKKNV